MSGNESLVSESRRRNMRAVKAKNTKPELRIRSLLHQLGYRFRLHRADLPGRPDIVFVGRRKVIEVRGCFWHQHPDPLCSKNKNPTTRASWWASKLGENRARDTRNERLLEQLGWRVHVVWECELTAIDELRQNLIEFLGPTSWSPAPSRERRENTSHPPTDLLTSRENRAARHDNL